jgi:hypothetical protein
LITSSARLFASERPFWRGGEPGGDLLFALVHRAEDDRPDELHHDPDDDREDQHLDDERDCDIH